MAKAIWRAKFGNLVRHVPVTGLSLSLGDAGHVRTHPRRLVLGVAERYLLRRKENPRGTTRNGQESCNRRTEGSARKSPRGDGRTGQAAGAGVPALGREAQR